MSASSPQALATLKSITETSVTFFLSPDQSQLAILSISPTPTRCLSMENVPSFITIQELIRQLGPLASVVATFRIVANAAGSGIAAAAPGCYSALLLVQDENCASQIHQELHLKPLSVLAKESLVVRFLVMNEAIRSVLDVLSIVAPPPPILTTSSSQGTAATVTVTTTAHPTVPVSSMDDVGGMIGMSTTTTTGGINSSPVRELPLGQPSRSPLLGSSSGGGGVATPTCPNTVNLPTSDIVSLPHASSSPPPSTHLMSLSRANISNIECPICLDALADFPVLITLCHHTFHLHCFARVEETVCPLCRYDMDRDQKATCSRCSTSEDLWLCLVCGALNCGRYTTGHAFDHYLRHPSHQYTLQVGGYRVWDYGRDMFVDRLIATIDDEEEEEEGDEESEEKEEEEEHGHDGNEKEHRSGTPIIREGVIDEDGNAATKHTPDMNRKKEVRRISQSRSPAAAAAAAITPPPELAEEGANETSCAARTTEEGTAHGVRKRRKKKRKDGNVSSKKKDEEEEDDSGRWRKLMPRWSAFPEELIQEEEEIEQAKFLSRADALATFYSQLLQDLLEQQQRYYREKLLHVASAATTSALTKEEEEERVHLLVFFNSELQRMMSQSKIFLSSETHKARHYRTKLAEQVQSENVFIDSMSANIAKLEAMLKRLQQDTSSQFVPSATTIDTRSHCSETSNTVTASDGGERKKPSSSSSSSLSAAATSEGSGMTAGPATAAAAVGVVGVVHKSTLQIEQEKEIEALERELAEVYAQFD